MSEHTPGKISRRPDSGQWNVSTDESGMSCYESIQDGDGAIIGFVVAHKSGFYQEPSTEANARRLVAAWNACTGMSTEDLEAMRLCSGYAKKIESLIEQRDSLRAVNAELLEALEDAATSLETINRLAGKANYGVDDNGPIPTYMGHHDEVRGYAGSRAGVARAAIASARKQKGEA